MSKAEKIFGYCLAICVLGMFSAIVVATWIELVLKPLGKCV